MVPHRERTPPTHGRQHRVAAYVTAVGCGHDHVNEFCGLKYQQQDHQGNGSSTSQSGPWLCYGGGSGFGGYSSYDGKRYHRRTRVWELDTSNGSIKTWKRIEYSGVRTDEIVLTDGGAVVAPSGMEGSNMVVAV